MRERKDELAEMLLDLELSKTAASVVMSGGAHGGGSGESFTLPTSGSTFDIGIEAGGGGGAGSRLPDLDLDPKKLEELLALLKSGLLDRDDKGKIIKGGLKPQPKKALDEAEEEWFLDELQNL